MIAAQVAIAFNTVNERKMWTARPYATDGVEAVHFTASNNLVTLVMECDGPRFYVRFNKVHAAWGDYVRAVARSMHVVLSTLKASGLPFNAPDGDDGIEITATTTPGVKTYVAWPGMIPQTVESATVPELRDADPETIAND